MDLDKYFFKEDIQMAKKHIKKLRVSTIRKTEIKPQHSTT